MGKKVKDGGRWDSPEVTDTISKPKKAAKQVWVVPNYAKKPPRCVDWARWFDTTKPIPRHEVKRVMDRVRESMAGKPEETIQNRCMEIRNGRKKFNAQFKLVWVKELDAVATTNKVESKPSLQNMQFVQVMVFHEEMKAPRWCVDWAKWFDTTKPIPLSEARKVIDIIKEVLAGQPTEAIGSVCGVIASACQRFNGQFSPVWVKKTDAVECVSSTSNSESANTIEGDALRASVEVYAKKAARSAVDQAKSKSEQGGRVTRQALGLNLSQWCKTDGRIGKQAHHDARRKMLAAAGELTTTAACRKTKALRRAVLLHNCKFPKPKAVNERRNKIRSG